MKYQFEFDEIRYCFERPFYADEGFQVNQCILTDKLIDRDEKTIPVNCPLAVISIDPSCGDDLTVTD